MPNRDLGNDDGLAQLLARGPAAADEAAKALEWIEFRGGPLEGKTGPEGSGSPLAELRLMHFPPAEEPPEGQAFLEILVYRRQADVRYVYQETLREPMPSSEYAELLEAREVLQKLRGLITDQRLVEPPSPHSGSPDALPLEDARKLKRRGVARFRREMREIGRDHVALFSDEQVWAFVRGTMQADLEWAALGSVLHHKGMLMVARDRFGLPTSRAAR